MEASIGGTLPNRHRTSRRMSTGADNTSTDGARATPVSPVFEAIARSESFQSEVHEAVFKEETLLDVQNFCLWYGRKQALFDISLKVPVGKVTAIVGPSGCGKSTLLRSVNRLNDLVDSVRIGGDMLLNGDSIYGAGLWDEVKDRLNDSALQLSGGQQQRLCIARAIAAEPEVLLLDEPCSALDPIATGRIEDLIEELKGSYSILIVTHNMQQASRASDFTAFMYLGRLIEYGPTNDIFLTPHLSETEDYVTGRFG